VVESATDFAIFSMDPSGLVTSWNRGAERVLGYAEEEILGVAGDAIFTPEDRAAGVPEQERQQALTNGRAEDERWTMRRDGTRFWASGLAMPLADPTLGFVKILRDRTDAHSKEARIRESEERFRLLATSIPQLVFLTRSDGWRSWGSPQWIDFTGLSFDDSLGSGWLDAIHADDREETWARWTDAQRSGEYYAEHRVRRSADGQFRWHQTRARPINEASGSSDWVGIMTDIHELRMLQHRQQVLLSELQHRTRNLLAVVQAIANQTRRSSDSFEAFGVEFQSRLRALSRVQSLLEGVEPRDVDLRSLIAAELTAHGDGSPTGKAHLDGPPVSLPASSAQALGLALHELGTNAVKYRALTQPQGRLEISWRVEQASNQRHIVLDWNERGVSMPERGQPKQTGYGLELIRRALPYQLGAKTTLDFRADGVSCTIVVPLKKSAEEARYG
jgi:PAS domain S-box-containing protein